MKLSQLVLLLQISLIGLVNSQRSNCTYPGKCGHVTIPYPFSTEVGCYLDESYYIECNSTTQIPRLNLSSIHLLQEKGPCSPLEILEIDLEGQLRVKLPIIHACYDNLGLLLNSSAKSFHLSRFPLSQRNKFVGVGCDIKPSLKLTESPIIVKCQSKCVQTRNGSHVGLGFCKTDIPSQNMTYAQISIHPLLNYGRCGYAFIVENHKYFFNESHRYKIQPFYPAVLEWSVGNTTCEEALKDERTYKCKDNTVCENGESNFGYRCKCPKGFRGNAYIKNGCDQDVDECKDPKLNNCLPGLCKNTYGSFTCVCPKGHQGNPTRGGECTPVGHKNIMVIDGISEGVAGAALTLILAYFVVKHRITLKGRKDFYKQNGGIILEKMLSTCHDPVNKLKIFTEEELNRATDNFNDTNIIGQGGNGTVYKGTFSNKILVAIKKSKVIDQSQIQQFVNEVIILSQIKHRNIVKLLGCCLETHVPLLVYEFISNNTLCHHIHTHPMLTFRERLKIAAETAGALAYMHSTTQIIHRDVKPSNILLDNESTAKVADFGISRVVPLGRTHLSTSIKGTIGYVDPEYFRTSKLTEKSDVYSFGVVLLELLTGTKIHSLDMTLTVYRGAAAYLASLLEHDALVQILDDQLKRDEYAEVVKHVTKIAINCLHLEGHARPSMKEVHQELEQLRYLLLSIIEAESL